MSILEHSCFLDTNRHSMLDTVYNTLRASAFCNHHHPRQENINKKSKSCVYMVSDVGICVKKCVTFDPIKHPYWRMETLNMYMMMH